MNKNIDRLETKFALMENHDSAYYVWKKLHFSKEVIVHVDAHLDILADSTNNIHFGNYLFQVIKEGIASKLYWVVPGNRKQFISDLIIIKKIISSLNTHDHISNVSINPHFSFKNGVVETSLYGISVIICTLEDLPEIKEKTLLDIDVDFFIIDRVRNNSNLENIGERKPWVDINTFVRSVQKKIENIKFITLAYSVNEGYTPLIYKTLGDKIISAFGHSDLELHKRLLAGKCFSIFRKQFDANNLLEAKKYFEATINLNPCYLIPENTYGGLFLKKKDFNKAENEFSKMLVINKNDMNCLIGLGIVNLYKRRLVRAKKYFNTALKLNPRSELCLLYLTAIEYKDKKYSKSKMLAKKAEELNPNGFYPKYLLGKLYENEGNQKLCEEKYQEALQTGTLHDIPLALELLTN